MHCSWIRVLEEYIIYDYNYTVALVVNVDYIENSKEVKLVVTLMSKDQMQRQAEYTLEQQP